MALETAEKQFFLTFIGVIALLIIIALLVLLVAHVAGNDNEEHISEAQIKLSNERIKPIGKVNLKSKPVEEIKQDPTTIVEVAKTDADESAPASGGLGEKVYNSLCFSCHANGVAGAPIVGHIDDWSKRLASGREKLYQSAIQGVGAMPPKGGNPSLTDADIKAAVNYMIGASQ